MYYRRSNDLRPRIGRALLAAALGTLLPVLALPSAAHADGSVGFGASGDLFYSDTSTAPNDLLVRMVGNEISIHERSGRLTAAAPCRVSNLSEAICPADALTVTLRTFGGSDKVEYRLPHEGFVNLGDGNDTLIAGNRQAVGRLIQPVTYRGGAGYDVISYSQASAGVIVDMADNLANDGRPGDRENVSADFEFIYGSRFNDTLFGTPNPDGMSGLAGDDFIAGGFGDDVFYSPSLDGADDYHGGPGRDTIEYFGRTQPLLVSLDNVANDGERGERDNVRSNVENINGGSAGDVLESLGAFSRLDGRGGDDFLFGGAGPDTLIGGPGIDNLNAGSGNDVVDSRDGQPDTIDCGDGSDMLLRDSSERRVVGCESVQIGTLRLVPKAIRTPAGKLARLRLSWRHPRGWRKLRSIELRLYRNRAPVGRVTVTPRRQRLRADGRVELVRKASRLTRTGKTVTARLAVRLDKALAGQTLKAEVEATDTHGRRQLKRNAGTVRVTK